MHKKGLLNDFIEFKIMCYYFYFRPFRKINTDNNSKSWDRVNKLEKGKVYVEVND